MSDAPVDDQTHLIVVESGDGQSEKLLGMLAEMGLGAHRVADLDEACQLLEEPWSVGRVVMIPSTLAAERVTRSLKKLRRAAPPGMHTISFGDPPDRKWRKRLRAAGVTLALWEPFDPAMLRCQLDRAVYEDSAATKRGEARVPAHLMARVLSGGRLKEGLVSSISTTGAFFETPRPNVEGATIELELRLPTGPVMIQSQVAFANVPGNLQRPNLPLGMGVGFIRLEAPDEATLRDYVAERRSHFEV